MKSQIKKSKWAKTADEIEELNISKETWEHIDACRKEFREDEVQNLFKEIDEEYEEKLNSGYSREEAVKDFLEAQEKISKYPEK